MIPLDLEVWYVVHFELIDSSPTCSSLTGQCHHLLHQSTHGKTSTTIICRTPTTTYGWLLIADAQHLTSQSHVKIIEHNSGNTVPYLKPATHTCAYRPDQSKNAISRV